MSVCVWFLFQLAKWGKKNLFWTKNTSVFFFNCSNWEKVVEKISETNRWKHLMNSLNEWIYLHCILCILHSVWLKSIKTFIGWGLHSARKWTIVLDKLLTIMVGHFFSDHSPILHCGVSFFLSINNKVHNDAFFE